VDDGPSAAVVERISPLLYWEGCTYSGGKFVPKDNSESADKPIHRFASRGCADQRSQAVEACVSVSLPGEEEGVASARRTSGGLQAGRKSGTSSGR